MNYRRKYYKPLPRYTFNADDDWGDYDNGKYREGHKVKGGYIVHWYKCEDGKGHNITEHSKKWEYFNGKIPEGYEIDHIIPIKNGGTNKLSNLRLATPKQNANNELTKQNISKGLKGKYTKENSPNWGKKQTKELIEKRISKIRGEKHYLFGKHRTEEIKEKIRLSKLGKKYPQRQKPIVQLTLNNEFVKEWNSSFETKDYGFLYKNVNGCCNGTQKTHKNFKWMFKSDYEKMLEDIATS